MKNRKRGVSLVRSGRSTTTTRGRIGGALPHHGENAEDEAATQLPRYWQIIWTRRFLVLGVVLLVVGATAAGTLLKEPVYRATGMIELRQPEDDFLPAQSASRAPQISSQHLETQYALLNSPVLARRVGGEVVVELRGTPSVLGELPRRAGVSMGRDAIPPEPLPDADVPPDSASASPPDLESATAWVRSGLSIDPLRGSRLVRVTFDATDPDLAARVVNTVFQQFSELRLEAARAAVERLSAQGDTARQRLASAEGRLQNYLQENQLHVLEDGSGESTNILHERLQRLQQELTAAEADRYGKEALQNILAEGEAGYLDSGVLESLNVRIAELRSEHARLMATFTEDYPRAQQVRRQLEELEELLVQERRRLGSRIQNDHRAAVDRERMIRSALEEQMRAIDSMAGTTAQYYVLRREVAGHLDLYSELQRKRREAEVSAAAAATEVVVVETAHPPQVPISPVPKRDLPLALLVGLVFGIGLAFLREYTDTAVHTLEELHTATELPVLGVIPSATSATGRRSRRQLAAAGKGNGGNGARTPLQLRPALADHRVLEEAFSGLRTSMLFDLEGTSPRSLLITSAQPGEGKSTVSINLAMSLANLDRRTLLIDADVRRPAVQGALGIDAEAGLTDFLEGREEWKALVTRGVLPGLDVLSAGRRTRSPSDVLSSPRMRKLVNDAEEAYEFVIIDSPALMIDAADTRTLAPLVDGVLLVVRSGVTSRELVRRVIQLTPRVIGVVLNDLDIRTFTAYYDRYGDEPTGQASRPGSNRT